MKWENLFENHILNRGYDYYCQNAVKNLEVSDDMITADVIGTEDYEVEIDLDHEKVTDMYCSCPYADGGAYCKHMAAVLYQWKECKSQMQEEKNNDNNHNQEDCNLFLKAHTKEAYQKKGDAIRKLVDSADMSVVKSYLVSVLAENEELLLRFHCLVKGAVTREDIKQYKKQMDHIANRYLGRDRFISYYEARGFISKLSHVLNEDVRRIMDNKQYMSAFELMNHMFVLIGNVDIDDSDGRLGELAEEIYEMWVEMLSMVNEDEKKKMFHWFTTHLNGSVIDYLEEYIEQVIMEEFQEETYIEQKMHFVEDRINKLKTLDSGWSRSYQIGKWAIWYLSLMELQKCSRKEIDNFCRKYWESSRIRQYYIDLCMEEKEYELALKVLDESIHLDKNYAGLISNYNKTKKEIYLLQGNKDAYVKQLWEQVLHYEAGNLEIYRELKAQYTKEDWIQKREKIFQNLPKYANINLLYEEEQLYDRLLENILKSRGIHTLQRYTKTLKKDYPEPLLKKYTEEINQMASHTSDRKTYREMVGILRSMKKIKGGSEIVENIVKQWKNQYKNRPAMMDELTKL